MAVINNDVGMVKKLIKKVKKDAKVVGELVQKWYKFWCYSAFQSLFHNCDFGDYDHDEHGVT